MQSIGQKGFQSTVDYLHANRDLLLDPSIDVIVIREKGYPDGNFCWMLEQKMNITLYEELSQPSSWVNMWVDQVSEWMVRCSNNDKNNHINMYTYMTEFNNNLLTSSCIQSDY